MFGQWRGQQRWEWSGGQRGVELWDRTVEGSAHAMQDRLAYATGIFSCSHFGFQRSACFLFCFNSGNYIFQFSFYGNKLVGSLFMYAPNWFWRHQTILAEFHRGLKLVFSRLPGEESSGPQHGQVCPEPFDALRASPVKPSGP